jgi:biopolymer transport protein ExbD
MSKFKKKTGGGTPAISTASLPDIVFMLLFFFMVTTVMREVTLLVRNDKPFATEIKKLEKKNLVTYIYAGKPVDRLQGALGTEPRIQLNDAFANISEIQNYVIQEREEINEAEKALMVVSIKADKNVKMGLITDIKQELRKANTLKINYSTRKGEVFGDKR